MVGSISSQSKSKTHTENKITAEDVLHLIVFSLIPFSSTAELPFLNLAKRLNGCVMDCREIRFRRECPPEGALLIPYWFLVHWSEGVIIGATQLIKGRPRQPLPADATFGTFRSQHTGELSQLEALTRRSRKGNRSQGASGRGPISMQTKAGVLFSHANAENPRSLEIFVVLLSQDAGVCFYPEVPLRLSGVWQICFKSFS